MSTGRSTGKSLWLFPYEYHGAVRRDTHLIHFDQPLGDLDNPRGQAQHYLGYSEDLETRLDQHAKGNGARLMEVVAERRTPWRLAATWPGDPALEKQMKRQHNSPRFCPICRAARDKADVR